MNKYIQKQYLYLLIINYIFSNLIGRPASMQPRDTLAASRIA